MQALRHSVVLDQIDSVSVVPEAELHCHPLPELREPVAISRTFISLSASAIHARRNGVCAAAPVGGAKLL